MLITKKKPHDIDVQYSDHEFNVKKKKFDWSEDERDSRIRPKNFSLEFL